MRGAIAMLGSSADQEPSRRLSGGVGPLRGRPLLDDAQHRLFASDHASNPRRSDMLGSGFWSALLAGMLCAGCGADDVTVTDSRFATPERTVRTLLGAYGLADTPQDEIRARIAERGAFELRDRAAWAECFADLDQPAGEGMAGYVFGLLAAARDDLRFETTGDRASVFPRDGITIAMIRDASGAYRIVLAESVPPDVRRSMLQVEQNAGRRVPGH